MRQRGHSDAVAIRTSGDRLFIKKKHGGSCGNPPSKTIEGLQVYIVARLFASAEKAKG
jgi:hypothetical protein